LKRRSILKQAVFWDNDGILVDSESAFFEVSREAFARLGLELTKEMWGLQFLGEGRSSREIAASLGGDPEKFIPVLDERNEIYRELLRKQPPPVRPQVMETILHLHGKVKLGVVTGSHRDQFYSMHRSSDLPDYFDVIITGDDCDLPKPDPGLYLAALEALDLCPHDCVAIEDSRRGLLSARAAGIECIVAPTELTRMQEFTGALAVVDDIAAILNYV
jgi:HAD superfamily hydrolase (TIGR01509 family)